MPERRQISCINRNNLSSAYERIENVGGTTAGGNKWKLGLTEAIKSIENGTYVL